MIRTTQHHPFQIKTVCLLVVTLCHSMGHAQTQSLATSLAAQKPAISRDRELTRQQIERVESDKAGALDDASSFGLTLPAQLIQRQEQVRDSAARRDETPLPMNRTPSIQEQQWPKLAVPSSQRLLKRPPAGGILQEEGAPVFSPDFSRQRLTLSGLVNQRLIDLPNQEVANLNADTPLPKIDVEEQKAMSLNDLVSVGLSYSPVMDQTRAQLETAITRAKVVRADLLPRVGIRYGQGPERSGAVGAALSKHETSTLAARLTQPIVNIPMVLDWMSELKGQQAASWRLQATKESVSLAVTNAVTSLAAARVVLEFSDVQLAQFTELLNYVQSRAQTGATSNADLERTRSRVLLARQIRIEQQATYRNALLELERLTGQVPEALELPYLNQLPGLPVTQGQLRRLVWDHSYGLRALRADIKAQTHTVESQYNKMLPTLDLSIEHDETKNVGTISPKRTDDRIMVVATWALSLGGKEIYAGRAAAAELNNRQAKLTEEGERLMQAVDADFSLLQSATLRVNTGEAEQKATAAVVASVQEQLKTGRIGSLLEALDAFERHFAARQRLTQTLLQQIQAQAQLLSRLGLLSQLAAQSGVQLEPAVVQPQSSEVKPKMVSSPVPETSTSDTPKPSDRKGG